MAKTKLSTVQMVILVLLGATLVASLPLWLRSSDEGEMAAPVPWLIENHDDGSRSVIGIHLDHDTLLDVKQRFGVADQLALFVQKDGKRSLEAYYPRIGQRGLTAKLVVTLGASEELLEALPQQAIRRESSTEGDARFHFDAGEPGELGKLPISALTYIPDYRGLDDAFIRDRFGEPKEIKSAGDRSQQWFYPELGLNVLIDPLGLEVFQYAAPSLTNTSQDDS